MVDFSKALGVSRKMKRARLNVVSVAIIRQVIALSTLLSLDSRLSIMTGI